jgi:hypothetical protein
MTSLAQPRDGFEPAEDLFDPLALLLANRIAGVTSGALINDLPILRSATSTIARIARSGWPTGTRRSAEM